MHLFHWVKAAVVASAFVGVPARTLPDARQVDRPSQVSAHTHPSSAARIEVSFYFPKPRISASKVVGQTGRTVEIPGTNASDENNLPVLRRLIAIPDCDSRHIRIRERRTGSSMYRRSVPHR